MLTLRNAHLNDAAMLYHWNQQEHVIACAPDDRNTNWTFELLQHYSWREILIAQVDERPIGVVIIIDPQIEETHYWGDIGPDKRAIDIWIGEKLDLNKGHGTSMMKKALSKCFAVPGVAGVIIDPLVSNMAAIRFYQRLGFVFVENRWFYGDYCAVHSISRKQWERVKEGVSV